MATYRVEATVKKVEDVKTEIKVEFESKKLAILVRDTLQNLGYEA